MIDGTQLLTFFAAGAYMAIGAVVGFIAGLILIPPYCITHPLVLALWERHRRAVEMRKRGREMTKIIVDKMKETDLQATKEIFREHLRGRYSGSDTTNQHSN